jgi:hypothetical protein
MMTALQQGPQIFSMYGNSLAGMRTAFADVGGMAGGLVTKFLPLIGLAAAFGVGVASLTREIGQAGNKTVEFGDVALAAIQVPARAIYDFLEPAINGVSDWWGREMDIFADQTKEIVNFLTRNFLIGFETIKSGIMTLPDAFIVAGEAAANGFLNGIEWLVQQAAEKLNGLMSGLNGLLSMAGMEPIQLFDVGSLSIPDANLGGGAAQARINAEGAALARRTADINSTDYAGQAFSAIKDQAGQNATARIAKENEDALKRAAAAAERLAEAYGNIVRGGQEFVAQQELELRSIGMTEEAANALRFEQEMLNKAANDNINLSAAQTSELGALAQAMAAAEAAAKRAKEVFEFTKDLAKGFLSDLRSEMQDGASFWEAFGTAGMNVLDKIISKIEDNLVDALFSMGSAGGGGGLGNIFGMIGSLFGFADGGVFTNGHVQAFAHGGVVSKPTLFPMATGMGLMGEAGPEAIMPLRRGSDGRLGVAAANSNRPQQVHVTVGVAADNNGNLLPFVQGVAQSEAGRAGVAAVSQANKAAPGAVAQFQQQRAGGDYRVA